MPRSRGHPKLEQQARPPGRVGAELDALRLLRNSHIFAAAIREVLELNLLRRASTDSLTLSQFHLLRLMSANGHHQMGEAAGFLGVSPPAATKAIDKLERLGLLVRSPSAGDRRATLLSVSPKGRRLVRKYDKLRTAMLAPVLASFAPTEIKQLTELTARFAALLLSEQNAETGFCLRCAAYLDKDCPIGKQRGECPYQQLRSARARGTAPQGGP